MNKYKLTERLGGVSSTDELKEGCKVIFREASDEQVRWGSNDDPREYLEFSETYVVSNIRIHSWHTKVELKGFEGLKFNSVHFEVVKS